MILIVLILIVLILLVAQTSYPVILTSGKSMRDLEKRNCLECWRAVVTHIVSLNNPGTSDEVKVKALGAGSWLHAAVLCGWKRKQRIVIEDSRSLKYGP